MKREFCEGILNELPIACACIKVTRDQRNEFCDFEYVNVNNAFEDITGLRREKVLHKKMSLVGNSEFSKNGIEWIHLCKEFIQKGQSINIEHYSKDLNCWFRLGVKNLSWDSEHILLYLEDISVEVQKLKELKQEVEIYKYMSFHDSLTKLYNRAFFEVELKRLSTERELPLSVIMADVNDLKYTNDNLGHHIGDQLLQKTAEVLKSCCREGDIIARVGGDEFKILLPKTSHKDTEKIISRLIRTCNITYVEARPLSVSFGWATKMTDYEDIEQIQRKAEENMYDYKLRLKENVLKEDVKIKVYKSV